jgi:hypothetical protein
MFAPPIKAAEAAIVPQMRVFKPAQPIQRPGVVGGGTASSLAWDFSKTPVFPHDGARQPSFVQQKLTIGKVDDPLEHEADRIADRIMEAPTAEPSIGSAPPQLSRKCAECAEEDEAQMLQTKRVREREPAAEYAPDPVYKTLGSSGQALDGAVRTYFETRFGYDFSRVRVHNDGAAHEAAVSVDAKAYTAGSHLVFAAGQYAPHTPQGKHLLAHELTHVVQQSGGGAPRLIQRQVFHPRASSPKPAPRPARRHKPDPDVHHGCSGKDVSTPEATECINRNLTSPNSFYVKCSPGGKKECCEEIPDPPHSPIIICEEIDTPKRTKSGGTRKRP